MYAFKPSTTAAVFATLIATSTAMFGRTAASTSTALGTRDDFYITTLRAWSVPACGGGGNEGNLGVATVLEDQIGTCQLVGEYAPPGEVVESIVAEGAITEGCDIYVFWEGECSGRGHKLESDVCFGNSNGLTGYLVVGDECGSSSSS